MTETWEKMTSGIIEKRFNLPRVAELLNHKRRN